MIPAVKYSQSERTRKTKNYWRYSLGLCYILSSFLNLLFQRQLAKLFEHQIAISHAACSGECEVQ